MVSKITNPITPLEEVDKINEIIDDKADDSAVVHKTGDESISGTKTFNTRSLIVEPLDSDNFGVVKVDNVYSHPNSTLTIYAQHKGAQQLYPNLNLWADGTVDISTMTGRIALNTDGNQEVHAHTPNTTTSTSSTEVATCGWVNEKQYQHITNCITEIPQDIKLELSSGTLTLKAGSKVYSLDGSYNLINSDTSIANAWGSASKGIVFYNLGAAYNYYPFERLHSGSTNPTGLTGNSHINYNTTDNKFYQTTNAGSSWSAVSRRLPIACVTWDANNKITSIDRVFNGFGYIGSTIFALPGVKGLIPNGRKADGTLKNTEFTTSSVLTVTDTAVRTNQSFRLSDSSIQFGDLLYDEKNNYNRISNGDIRYFAIAGTLTSITGGAVTSFSPKTTFHAVDYNDSSTISGWAMPSSRYINLTLGASGATYTAPANGWFTLQKVTGSTGLEGINLFNQTSSNMGVTCYMSGASGYNCNATIPAKTGDRIYISYNASGNVNLFRFIYAEGEN